MSIRLTTGSRIAETSSKGNQENGWQMAAGTSWICSAMKGWQKP